MKPYEEMIKRHVTEANGLLLTIERIGGCDCEEALVFDEYVRTIQRLFEKITEKRWLYNFHMHRMEECDDATLIDLVDEAFTTDYLVHDKNGEQYNIEVTFVAKGGGYLMEYQSPSRLCSVMVYLPHDMKMAKVKDMICKLERKG